MVPMSADVGSRPRAGAWIETRLWRILALGGSVHTRLSIQRIDVATPSVRSIRLATCLNSVRGTRPSLTASDASIVAILAVRMSDGTGRPAAARSVTDTSPIQPRFFALVIITTHSSPCPSSKAPVDTTSAGRHCRVRRSVYGNGTLMTSPCSKLRNLAVAYRPDGERERTEDEEEQGSDSPKATPRHRPPHL